VNAHRVLSAVLASGILALAASSGVEAGWWDWLKGKPEAPKSIEQRAREAGDVGIRPGLLAPDFELERLGGGTLRLSSYRNRKAVILNFWATWFVPCRKEMPSLEALGRSHAKDGLMVLGVNIDADEPAAGNAAAFAKQTGVTFPVALDPQGRAARAYAVHGLPVTYLIGRDGLIAKRIFGDRDWVRPDVRARVKRLLLGRDTSAP
jgi:peroxiredoxin